MFAAIDESSCREFSVNPKRRGVPAVAELPATPKRCPHGSFSGSEVSFAVPSDTTLWLDVLNAVQSVLEATLMVAPPVSLELRILGFDEHIQVCCQQAKRTACRPMMNVNHAQKSWHCCSF